MAGELARRTGHTIDAEDRAATSTAAALPPSVALEDGLTADEAVALALWNDAAFQADLTRLGLAKADLAQAGLLPNPVLSLLFPLGPKQLELSASFGLSWIWQRPRRIAMAELDATRVADELVQSGLDLARDVRIAHADAVLAARRLALAKEAAITWSRIADLAEARLRAGAASRLEVGTARADARIAQIDADGLGHELEAANAKLAVLTGVPVTFDLVPSERPELPADVLRLVELALAARPDLRAAEIAIEAAGERAGWERGRIFDLVGILDANGRGAQGFEAGPGLGIALPIFDQNQAGRTRAEAEIARAGWQYLAVRRKIAGEVAAARARFLQARSALEVWPDQVLAPLEENLRLATSAYSSGGDSYIVVLEATRRLTTARRQEAELEAQLQRAAAELMRSIGGKPSE